MSNPRATEEGIEFWVLGVHNVQTRYIGADEIT